MESPKVSIIMAAFNEEQFLEQAIESVLRQCYENWELIIIDNGSTDNTLFIANSFSDPRIIVIEEKENGVSAARNKGLRNMSGDFFCFLDADDILPPHSIQVRVSQLLEKEDHNFIDGCVEVFDANLATKLRTYIPAFNGYVQTELLMLKGNCFFGPSWMIRRNKEIDYSFRRELIHGEDLDFYIRYSGSGRYSYVPEVILYARKHPGSAMTNLQGLARGYANLSKLIYSEKKFSFWRKFYFDLRRRKIMSSSFLGSKRYVKGFKYLLLGK